MSQEPCLLAQERALPVGLIIGELVTNAVKYAHPTTVTGKILAGCQTLGGIIVVHIANDGVALPEGFDPMRDGGLGLRLVRSLVQQVGGKLVFDDTGVGLSVAVRIPTERS